MRSKLTRKPLRDVSDAKTAMKSANAAKVVANDDGEQAGDDSLDRLLLVQSDLSSLLRQIDELVVLALQSPSNKGRKEIKQFADVLSEMQNSLKPWVPRFQKALISQSKGPEDKPAQPIERTEISGLKESTSAAVESPEETKWESLVSPSPLVSWKAECNTEGGRQLFLLTPLPQRKAFSSKPTPNIDFSIEVTKDVGNHQTDCASPEKSSNKDCSLFLMTPCLKMSPIKSCVLLEPISEISMKKKWGVHKCTPFPLGVKSISESEDSESSSGQSPVDLKLKYPELYGIKTENLQKRMVEEVSPNWGVSPPKTCVIMEPTDERQEPYQDTIGALDLAERTPMVKEPMSSFRMGKHPGENTLKRELWTKFEAASTHGICFNTSLLQTTTKKGFLDQLDEASDV
ncbi:hypothetical protein ACS0TY_035214 [Phlomoides rotata]